MDRELLIKNGLVIDPSTSFEDTADIHVKEGRIFRTGKNLEATEAEIFDASGMIVMPGLIDMHTHLREPGFEDSETILTGCESAAAGGFTAVCAMPNTEPATDDAGRVRFILERSRDAAVRVYPIGAITRGRKGEELSEMAEMVRSGAAGFSDDGVSVADAGLMLNALRYAAMVGKPLILHEEEPSLVRGGQMNESRLSAELGLRGMPRIAEEIMVRRDIALAEYTGTPIHLTHLSTRGSIEEVRKAKARGVKVTCDVTPHHLALTEEKVATFYTIYKMNPPLRTPDDIAALIMGINDKTIDCIATDHAPHSSELKERDFVEAAFGVTGLETALGVIQKELIDKGKVSWSRIAEAMSYTPAGILGVEGGSLREGAAADITIFDPKHNWTVEGNKMKTKSPNTCFQGMELPGRAAAIVVKGKLRKNF